MPTVLWVGASLYDGISPTADGSSDMRFVDEPDVRSLGEVEQDSEFRARSVAYAKGHPARVLTLAAVKFGRFWSPWPNADTLQAPGVALASALVTIPTFLLIGVGGLGPPPRPRGPGPSLGPVVYFCGLHLVFVSSIRYRIPGEVPALVLAALGCRIAWDRLAFRGFAGPPGKEDLDR